MGNLRELLTYAIDEAEEKLREDERQNVPVRVYTEKGDELIGEFNDFSVYRSKGEINIYLKEVE